MIADADVEEADSFHEYGSLGANHPTIAHTSQNPILQQLVTFEAVLLDSAARHQAGVDILHGSSLENDG